MPKRVRVSDSEMSEEMEVVYFSGAGQYSISEDEARISYDVANAVVRSMSRVRIHYNFLVQPRTPLSYNGFWAPYDSGAVTQGQTSLNEKHNEGGLEADSSLYIRDLHTKLTNTTTTACRDVRMDAFVTNDFPAQGTPSTRRDVCTEDNERIDVWTYCEQKVRENANVRFIFLGFSNGAVPAFELAKHYQANTALCVMLAGGYALQKHDKDSEWRIGDSLTVPMLAIVGTMDKYFDFGHNLYRCAGWANAQVWCIPTNHHADLHWLRSPKGRANLRAMVDITLTTPRRVDALSSRSSPEDTSPPARHRASLSSRRDPPAARASGDAPRRSGEARRGARGARGHSR